MTIPDELIYIIIAVTYVLLLLYILDLRLIREQYKTRIDIINERRRYYQKQFIDTKLSYDKLKEETKQNKNE